ncbi:hypothetical protein PV721_19875 [Streptomyces sp. MB09-01]|uniref:hypothetical protein n=1 Tax=Streptomyces sp. MB09-01 TaxID=3028666 RepID=UPI0029B2AD5F|nr:hypothetical protein [Streptomyces sp. MB09-01]MDX3536594.1 hypothetical protein [Streptomyces sp. MB09-01]
MAGSEPVSVGGVPVPVPGYGAWLRRGISRNGGPVVEDREVVWLQAGLYYADSRGFAGTTSVDGSQVRFHHLRGEPGEDVGVFRWEGVNLVERGTNADGSTFLEIWTPLSGAAGAAGSWSGPDHQVVRVGRHVVHVDSDAGTYWRL